MIKKIRQHISQLISIKKLENKRDYHFLKYMNSYEILFSYADYMNLEEKTFLYDIPDEDFTCIFCLEKKPLAVFKDNAHVIPYLLGNKFLMHHEECEACNKNFGSTLETELASFSHKFRVINGQKNRKKDKFDYLKYPAKSQKALLQMTKIDNEMRLAVTGDRTEDILKEHGAGEISLNFETIYRDSDVYKAFMKTIYGVIPPEYRKDFMLLRNWINTADYNIKFLNKLIMYQTILPTFHQDNLVLNVFRKKRTLSNMLFKKNNFDYVALIGFGNVFFDIPLMSDNTLKKIKNNSPNNNFIFPLLSDFVVNDKGALRTVLDMSNTERRTEKASFSLAEFK